ncbi:vacuolar membrane-associated protein iml1 [Tulasnella sp. JGI-2019a]|nr:vacuolar membrane-associated protein iml1 [Tulasnella sp. JGI-2019a]
MARKRSATVQSFLIPSTPKLTEGQTKSLTLWVNDNITDRVVLNHESWPGVSVGDVIQVQSSVSAARGEDTSNFCFVVGPDEGHRHGALQQISVPKHLATVFGLQNRSEVTLKKISKESVSADYVEIFFRDQYMGRSDMWKLGISLEEQCIHVEEKINFVGCVSGQVKALYVKGNRVSSAYVTSRTKMIYRSMSAKTTVFIQICRELWEFADDGERYYEKVCHSFLPALIERWQSMNATHVFTVVLISRVFYEESETEYADGPLRQDPNTMQWYKDFYKVILDMEVVQDWKPSLVYLKESFWTFQRDILLAHHYHQNIKRQKESTDGSAGKPTGDDPIRIVGRISMAHEGPVLEAINLSLNPLETHYIDRSLFLTGCSIIMVSPGTGYYRVNKRLLQLTTTRLLDQGFGLDLICMSKTPLHRTPVFCFRGVEPGAEVLPGVRETDPLWVWEEEDGPIPGMNPRRNASPQVKKYLYWEPFWVSLSFWDQQNDLPFREDRFVTRARMYEIQMLGLLEHDVSSTLAIPLLEDDQIKTPPNTGDGLSRTEALRQLRNKADSDTFALKRKPATQPVGMSSTSSLFITSTAPAPRPPSPHVTRAVSDFRPQLLSRAVSEEVSTSLSKTSSSSSMATTLANYNHKTSNTASPVRSPRNLSPAPQSEGNSEELPRLLALEIPRPPSPITTSRRSGSPSQHSVRSTSTTSTNNSKKRGTTITSRLGLGQWLFGSFRAEPSLAEAAPISIGRRDVDRTPLATPPPTPLRRAETMSASSSSGKATQLYLSNPDKSARPKPIAIKSSGNASRRPGGGGRVEQIASGSPSKVVALSSQTRSNMSPASGSPARDSMMGVAPAHRRLLTLEPVPTPATNPSRPLSILTASQASMARRWQHIFAQPTSQHQIKWKGITTPSCLPLTCEYYPSKTEIDKAYHVYSYDVLLTPDMHSSFLLKKLPGMVDEDWPLLIMRMMAMLRLQQGFQVITAPSPPAIVALAQEIVAPTGDTTSIPAPRYPITGAAGSGRYGTPTFPIGPSHVLLSIRDCVYLSMSNQIHRISFDPVEQVIQVMRLTRRTTHLQEPQHYRCLVWPRLGDGYKDVSATFEYPSLDNFGWNRMDMLVAGYEHNFAESLRYWRTQFLVIPSENPPTFNQMSGDKLSDEEIRLMGIEKLGDLFHKARWYKLNEKPEDFSAPRFLLTTLGPSACVLDEGLISQLGDIHAAGPLKKKRSSMKCVEDTPLATLAKAMKEEDGVPIKDNVWHRVVHPDSFTGYDFVSWLVREYKDVGTRDQGTAWGQSLMHQGLLEHCKGNHGFLDGHYYYRLKEEYAVSVKPLRPVTNKWFRASSMMNPRGGDDNNANSMPLGSTANLEAVLARPGATPASTPMKPQGTPKRSRRRLVLSQTMIIHVDPQRRSKDAETVILHHDVIQNPGTAFHFELNWVGTTAKLIDELLQSWSHSIEKYGLHLVEAYVDPITDAAEKSVFHSTYPIRLALAPPFVPNLERRLPEGTLADQYFESAILRQFDYILDVEAESRYSETVDVCYSYRRSSFHHSQFVHKSGLAFVVVIGGTEGFRWMTNRLAGASNSFNLSGWGGSGGGAGRGGGGGGGGAGRGKSSASSSMAPGPSTSSTTMHNDRGERERIATSVLIQKQLRGLSEFCSDANRLQAFYASILQNLAPESPMTATTEPFA